MEDNDLLKVRLEKIAALKAAGVDLYPNNIRPQNTTAEILAEFVISMWKRLPASRNNFL